MTAEELHEMFSVERSDENNTSGNTSINNDLLNDSSIRCHNSKKESLMII